MLHLLLGKDWIRNREEILTRIQNDVSREFPGRVLMVPELISHETERALCKYAGDTASRFAEVLSFSRMATRVAEETGVRMMQCLDAGGRLVAMASAARQLSSRLKTYAAVETKPEFLEKMIDAVDEFKRCCISSEDLRRASECTEGTLAQKLEELSLLMAAYDAVCANGKRDPRDQMTRLLEQLEESDYGSKHTFYICGFPDFTRQHMEILGCLISRSPDITISLTCDTPGSKLLAFEKAGQTASEILQYARKANTAVQIEIIPEREDTLLPVRTGLFQGHLQKSQASGCLKTTVADSLWQECIAAGQQVRSLVMGGCRYRDITVVVTDMTAYQPIVQQVFSRFHIPLYQSGTEEILNQPVISTVLSALDAVISGYDRKNVLDYLRSALSPLSQETCDCLENYTAVWNIHGKQWLTDWEFHPDGLSGKRDAQSDELLHNLNQYRTAAIVPLEHLRQQLAEARALRDQIMALYHFLEEIHFTDNLEQMEQSRVEEGNERDAQILGQLWEILLSAIEQMYDVLGNTYWQADSFTGLLRLLLSQYTVGTIPPVLDAVQMGSVSAMQCHSTNHLIVLGAEEGKLPGYSGSAGLLTDSERTELRKIGVPLTGGALEGVQSEFAQIYGVFSGARDSVHVYCSSAQPSFLFKRLEILSGGSEQFQAGLEFAAADSYESAALLASRNAPDTAEALGLQSEFSEISACLNHNLGSVSPEHVRNLYGKQLRMSASQIDTLAECRLRYFLQYGLRAKERKEATVDPAEFGTYVHDVLENTARCVCNMGGFHCVSLEQTLTIAHDFSDKYAQEHFGPLASQRAQYIFRRNIQELNMVVTELWKELSVSEFEPCGFEVKFDDDDGLLPAILISDNSVLAILRGFVDRVDVWRHRGVNYYRIVDYKTGEKTFDYCDILNGVGLQMLLYLFALKRSGGKLVGEPRIPAGVQYFPARAKYLSMDGKPDFAHAEAERESQWKRRGLLLKDDMVLQAIEPEDTPDRSFKRKKDGTIEGDFADRIQLDLLEQYVFRILNRLVADVTDGRVEPNPYTRGTSHNACLFCPYGDVCHKADVPGRRNYKAVKARDFWQSIEKELNADAE